MALVKASCLTFPRSSHCWTDRIISDHLERVRSLYGPVISEHWSEEQTDDPHYADQRNFYKIEKWLRDGMHIEEMLYAGSNLDRAPAIFDIQ